MIATINGTEVNVYSWSIREPRIGQWVARIHCDFIEAATGDSAEIDGIWKGTVRNATAVGAFSAIEIAAGADALATKTTPLFMPTPMPAAGLLALLCTQGGEIPDPTTVDLVSQWRMRGRSLRTEIERLAKWVTDGVWRYLPSGLIALGGPSGDAEAPGILTGTSANDYRVYETDTVTPLAGMTVDGWVIDIALYQRGEGNPMVTVWQSRDPIIGEDSPVAAGVTIAPSLNGRIQVLLDDGTILVNVPLFNVAGYKAELLPGVRVLVIDIDNDPRNTVAVAGVDGLVMAAVPGQPAITLGDGLPDLVKPPEAIGRVLRYGDTVDILGVPTPLIPPAALNPVPVSKVKA